MAELQPSESGLSLDVYGHFTYIAAFISPELFCVYHSLFLLVVCDAMNILTRHCTFSTPILTVIYSQHGSID